MIPIAHRPYPSLAILGFAIVAMGAPRAAWAISPLKLAGALEGRVLADGGHPQMGAVVQVFDRQDRLVDRELTDGKGLFVAAGLIPDVYSIRVTLATFLPAIRDQIHVQAGRSSLLDINLSGLFSSIRLLPPSTAGSESPSDDWKWVLRSSSSTRPIFRYLPVDPSGNDSALAAARTHTAVFTDSRGLVSFSAGDGDASGAGSPGELGTAFAFSTSLRGSSQVEFAGDVGYGIASDAPSAALRATFSHAFGEMTPEVSVTMRQLFIPRWIDDGAGFATFSALPPLRSLSVNMHDREKISGAIAVEYGVAFDEVAFRDRLHYLSPFARLTYALGEAGDGSEGIIDITYTSGNARPELGLENSLDPNVELQRDVAALGAVAPTTLRSREARVQRGEDYEVGYSRKLGSRTLRISGYRESVQNAALMLAGADGTTFEGDLLPDLYTNSLLFNAGNYHTMGYTAALTQEIGDHYQITVTYGSVGVLAPRSQLDRVDSPDELRSLIRPSEREAMAMRFSGTVPHAGTHFAASYQLMDDHAATAGHLYSTENDQCDPGLNFTLRQPIPAILGMPFRMEAAIDLRNLLAEGYLPITLADGQHLLLVHTPRSLRGGVNFRF